MNAHSLAQRAYAPQHAPIVTPRELERRALAHVTAKLQDAHDRREEIGGMARIAEAMSENVRLWSTFAEDCASDGNKLPPTLRRQIIGLAAFALVHMRRVFDKRETVEPLIDVNIAVMRGLAGETGTEPAETAS